jgi:hypothetical protein
MGRNGMKQWGKGAGEEMKEEGELTDVGKMM